MNVSPLEALWVTVNMATLVLSLVALREAERDRRAVRRYNGLARVIATEANVRREALRVIAQLLLLSVVVPSLSSDREVPLSWPVIALMAVPIVLFIQSLLDARERRVLTAIVVAGGFGE